MSISAVIVIIYLLLLLVLGAIAGRKIRTDSDYLVAGKSLGFWLFVMLVLGSVVSGMTLLGVAGLGDVAGWPSFWEQLFVPLSCAIMIIIYGYKLYEVSHKKNFFTVQDYLTYRYQGSNSVRVISSLAVLITSLIYLVGQYDAISIVLRWLLGLVEFNALFIGAFIVIIYVLMSGLYAVAWTNLVQGIIIVIGVIIMAPFVIHSAGGLSAINQTLTKFDPNFVSIAYPQAHPPVKPYAFCTPLFILSWFFLLSFGLGSAPHIINNVIAVKDKKYFRWSPLVIFVLYLIIMYLIKITGMAVRTLVIDGKITLLRPDDAFIAGVKYALPELIWPFFVVVVLAAVMSTTDRLLLVIGTCCGWDFYRQLINPNATSKQVTRVSRIGVLVFGTLSFVLALYRKGDLLAWLIWMGIGVMLSTFVVPIVFGLYWKRANRNGAVWSMIAGFATAVFFGGWDKFIYKLPVHFSLFSFIVSILVMIIVSLATSKPSEELVEESKTGLFIRSAAEGN